MKWSRSTDDSGNQIIVPRDYFFSALCGNMIASLCTRWSNDKKSGITWIKLIPEWRVIQDKLRPQKKHSKFPNNPMIFLRAYLTHLLFNNNKLFTLVKGKGGGSDSLKWYTIHLLCAILLLSMILTGTKDTMPEVKIGVGTQRSP